jgi:hypothetical protein
LEDTVCIGGHIVQIGSFGTFGVFNHIYGTPFRLPCDAFLVLAQFSKLTQLHCPSATTTVSSFAFRCAPGERVVVPCSFWELKDMVRMFWDFEPRGDGREKFGTTTRYTTSKNVQRGLERCQSCLSSMAGSLMPQGCSRQACSKAQTW